MNKELEMKKKKQGRRENDMEAGKKIGRE